VLRSTRLRALPSALLLLVLSALVCAPLAAQEPATAELNGKVLLADTAFAGARVTLHRVSTAGSGPIDSVLARKDGGFHFTLPSVPNPEVEDVIYFASVTHDGVNYFGPAIHLANELDSLYQIKAYDTLSAPPEGAQLQVQGRYTLLEPATGYWTATDLLQVVNSGVRTVIARPGGATWTYPLPEDASDLEIGGDQMEPDAITLVNGALRVESSLPPGVREFVVRYHVPDPFVSFPVPNLTGEMELLVKEPAPAMDVVGLTGAQPVEMEPGNVYRRFIGDSITVAEVEVKKGKGELSLPARWFAVGMALVLALAALYSVLFTKGEPAGAPAASEYAALSRLSPFERRQRLLLQVARLDESRDRGEIGADDEWAKRRRALLEQLQELG
jgi:hypothetical protein